MSVITPDGLVVYSWWRVWTRTRHVQSLVARPRGYVGLGAGLPREINGGERGRSLCPPPPPPPPPQSTTDLAQSTVA